MEPSCPTVRKEALFSTTVNPPPSPPKLPDPVFVDAHQPEPGASPGVDELIDPDEGAERRLGRGRVPTATPSSCEAAARRRARAPPTA